MKISSDTLWQGYQQPFQVVQQTNTVTLQFSDTNNLFYSGYPHKVFDGCYGGYKLMNFSDNSTFQTKSYGFTLTDYTILSGDTLHPVFGWPCDTTLVVGERFGMIYKGTYLLASPSNGYWTDTYLIGAAKGNLHYGHITPNWMFHSGAKEYTPLQIKIYPIPAHDKISVEGLSAANTLHLVNGLGQIVFEEKRPGNKTEIDLSALEAGVYALKIADEHGGVTIRMILKN
jgi:hypothetical protein